MGIFNAILIDPMVNIMVVLYSLLFNNFGLAIITFTIIVRLATLPLQMKQTRQMKAMTGLQPRMKEIQARYAKEPQKKTQETMRLYKEAGVNPVGCIGPMAVLMVVLVALYQALIKILPTTPDHLIGLSQRLYSWNPVANSAVPINSDFFGLDLANPDPTRIVMPVLVGATTWAQQKMTTPTSMDPKQQSTSRMMLWMMPIMLALFTLSFPSGLALYWVVSSAIGVLIHGFMTRDWSPLIPNFAKAAPVPEPAPQPATEQEPKEMESDGTESDVGKNRRRGHRTGAERARRKSGRSRNRNTKPR